MATAVQQTGLEKIKDGTFEPEGHVYRNGQGVRVPSVTQVLAMIGLCDFSRVPRETLERKRKIGTAVHLAAEFLDSPEKGELDWDSVDQAAVGYLLGYEKFLEDTKFKPISIEHAGITQQYAMQYGYRIDRIGLMGGSQLPTLLELKCAYREEIAWPLQLAGYELAAIPVAKIAPKAKKYCRIAVQLKPDGSFKICGPYGAPTDQRHFLSALSLTWLKLNSRFELPDVGDDFGMPEEEI